MPTPGNLVEQTTTGTGTGPKALSQKPGRQTFLDAFGTGGTDVFDYAIIHRTAVEWERGTGHVDSGGRLVSDAVLESSNGNAAVDFSEGIKDVTNFVPADEITRRTEAQTVEKKTFNLADNTLTGTTAQFNAALSDDSFATLTNSVTLTNKTIDADNNTISNLAHGAEVDNPSSGVHGVTGDVVGTADTQTLTNKTIDADNNTISNLAHGAEVDNPSSGVHGVTGDVVGTTDTQTLSSKTVDLDSNTLTGLPAEFDSALQGDTFVFTSEVGSVVQAHDAGLDDISALAVTDGNFIVGDGDNWVAESGATARASMSAQEQGDVLDDLNTLGAVTADGEVLVGTGAGAFAWESGATLRTSIGVGTGDSPTFAGLTSTDDITIDKTGATLQLGGDGGDTGPHGLQAMGTTASGLEMQFLYRTGPEAWSFEDEGGNNLFTVPRDGSVPYVGSSTANAVLQAATTDELSAGFSVAVHNAGTQSSGTYTPDEANGNFQRAVNGGAHDLAPPTNDCNIIVQYTNNASAGAIGTSGFTQVTGDSFDTTNGNDFLAYITKINGFSHLNVVALQ